VVDDDGGHPNVGFTIVRQYRMADIGVAGTAREIAAGDVDFEAVAGVKGVTMLGRAVGLSFLY
jgi:hypothetical protein